MDDQIKNQTENESQATFLPGRIVLCLLCSAKKSGNTKSRQPEKRALCMMEYSEKSDFESGKQGRISWTRSR